MHRQRHRKRHVVVKFNSEAGEDHARTNVPVDKGLSCMASAQRRRWLSRLCGRRLNRSYMAIYAASDCLLTLAMTSLRHLWQTRCLCQLKTDCVTVRANKLIDK